jgi:gamma-glutamyltranspeptidase/glutathione hydrolase
VIRGAAAAASQPEAASAASAALEAGGSAVDGLIAGFFGAAGAHPGVLLAPAVALVAGFGAGARAFDGRAAQPGRGAARPRGYVDDASVPDGARVAAPRSLSMLMLLHTYRGRALIRELARAGVDAAEAAGSKARATLLRRVGAAGVLALRGAEVQRALLAAGGPVAGGILTAEDIEGATPAEAEATTHALGEGLSAFAPPFPPGDEERGDAEVIVACDGRGGLAALSYVPARGGIALPEIELAVGRDAVPVRRGVTRLAPGTLLSAAAPIAVLMQGAGFAAAVGLPGRPLIEAESLRALAGGMALEAALAELRERTGSRAAVAAATDGRTARTASV